MKVTQVTVDFKKTVSDGNYGNETAQAQYVVLVDEGEDPDDVVRQVISRARGRAVAELSGSESISVRRALNPPKRVCSECGEALGDEESYYHTACGEVREERYRRERAERQAERQLVAVGAAEDLDDDEDRLDGEDEDDAV